MNPLDYALVIMGAAEIAFFAIILCPEIRVLRWSAKKNKEILLKTSAAQHYGTTI